MIPRQVLLNFADDGRITKQGGFFLLCGFAGRRLTAASQQNRAVSLMDALVQTGRLRAKTRVGIIGGGIAGCTAGYWAACHGATVHIYEQNERPLNIYSKARHRWLHPHLFNWPMEGWDTERTHLPCLNWSFAPAKDVENKLWEKVLELQKSVGEEHFQWTVNAKGLILAPPSKGLVPEVKLPSGDTYAYDVLIVAVGIGTYDLPAPSYWDGEEDERFFASIRSGQTRRAVVIGNGDGGLVDIIRMKSHLNTERDMLDFIGQWKREHPVAYGRLTNALLANSEASGAEFSSLVDEAVKPGDLKSVRDLLSPADPSRERLSIEQFSNSPQFHAGSSSLLRFLLKAILKTQPNAVRIHNHEVDFKGRTISRYWDDVSEPQSISIDAPPAHLRILNRAILTRPLQALDAASVAASRNCEILRLVDWSKGRQPYGDADFFSKRFELEITSDSHEPFQEDMAEVDSRKANAAGPIQSRYITNLRSLCDTVAIPSVNLERSRGSDVSKIDSSLALLSCFVGLDVAEESPKDSSSKAERIPQVDVKPFIQRLTEGYASPLRIILMGEGGRGKTTMSSFLARSLSATEDDINPLNTVLQKDVRKLRQRWQGFGPVFIRLRDLAGIDLGQDDLFDSLLTYAIHRTVGYDATNRLRITREDSSTPVAQSPPRLKDIARLIPECDKDPLNAWIGKGQILLILDGMDELPWRTDRGGLSLRQVLVTALHKFSTSDLGKRFDIILTSRVGSVRADSSPWYPILNWNKWEIQPLAKPAGGDGPASGQKLFAQRYFQFQGSDQPEDDAEKLLTSCQRRGLEEMTREPLLLAVLVRWMQRNPDKEDLPSNRVRILDAAIRLMLDEWDQQRGLLNSVREVVGGKIVGIDSTLVALRRFAVKTLLSSSAGGSMRSKPLELRGELEWSFRHTSDPEQHALNVFKALRDRCAILRLVGDDNQPDLEFTATAYANLLAGLEWLSNEEAGKEFFENLGTSSANHEHWRQAFSLGVAGVRDGLHRQKGHPPDLESEKADWECVWRAFQQVMDAARNETDHDRRRELYRAVAEAAREVRFAQEFAIQSDNPTPPELVKLRDEVLSVFQDNSAPVRTQAAIGEALGWLGDGRKGVGVRRLGKGVMPDFAWSREVPPGTFRMGNSKKAAKYVDESPQFSCSLIQHPFRFSVHPVTVAQFQLFILDDGYKKNALWPTPGWEIKEGTLDPKFEIIPEEHRQSYRRWFKGERFPWTGPRDLGQAFICPNHPVVGVSWWEAVAFCNWLNQKAVGDLGHDLGLPHGWRVRLPTEAEWERVATQRSGQRVTYPWGNQNDVAARCNCEESKIGQTSAVGMFGERGRAEIGCEDLSGNVFEWCSTGWTDDYTDYQQQPGVRGETNPGSYTDLLNEERLRVVRGGSWNYNGGLVRGGYRLWCPPYSRVSALGFRLAASPISEL